MRQEVFKVLAASSMATVFAFLLSLAGPFRSLENKAYDALFHFRGSVEADSGAVALVTIDEKSVEQLGTWPWPRDELARLVAKVKEGKPRVLGIDLLLDVPGRTRAGEDEALAEALGRPPKTVVPVVVDTEKLGRPGEEVLFRPLDVFLGGGTTVGAANIVEDPIDNTTREFRPLYGSHLGYPVAVLAEYFGVGEGDIGEAGGALKVGSHSMPLSGGEALINYRGINVEGISAVDVLEPWCDPSFFFRDRIVLLGRTDMASKDIVNTPVPSGRLFESRPMFGVEVWTEILDMILRDDYLRRVPATAVAALMLLLSGAVGAAGFRSNRVGAAALAAAAAFVLPGSYLLFSRAGLVLPAARLLAACAAGFAVPFGWNFVVEMRERRMLAAAFGSYVSPHVLEGILSKRIELDVGGKRKKLTMLFLDIKGFSDFVDAAEPEEVMEYVKAFFSEMNRIVTKHGGMVDKMLGDGLLAIYGDFTDPENQARNAVAAALEMQRRTAEMAGSLGHGLAVRIGVNTGYVTVGNVGSEEHLDYTVIGRGVGLAKRLESACEPGKVLVADSTWQMLKGSMGIEAERTEEITVKGFSRAVKVHLLAVPPPDGREGEGG